MTKEERLLKAIYRENNGEDGKPDNYPETFYEKAGYAEYCLQKSLESISPALRRIGRLSNLILVSKEDGVSTLPDIITNNECRMALESLIKVRFDVDEALTELKFIYQNTKGAVANVPLNNETA